MGLGGVSAGWFGKATSLLAPDVHCIALRPTPASL